MKTTFGGYELPLNKYISIAYKSMDYFINLGKEFVVVVVVVVFTDIQFSHNYICVETQIKIHFNLFFSKPGAWGIILARFSVKSTCPSPPLPSHFHSLPLTTPLRRGEKAPYK